jgi:hypothetical protein
MSSRVIRCIIGADDLSSFVGDERIVSAVLTAPSSTTCELADSDL